MKKKFTIEDKYSEKTKKHLSKIISSLYEEQGGISQANEFTLSLLADNLELYYKIMDRLNTEGLTTVGKDKTITKHPLIAVLNSTNLFLAKLINNLGLTPVAKHKMKIAEEVEDDELDKLING